jgi:hypothetical protein
VNLVHQLTWINAIRTQRRSAGARNLQSSPKYPSPVNAGFSAISLRRSNAVIRGFVKTPRLREIAATGVDMLPLAPHEEFEAAIRSRHARKVAFWVYVNSTRRDDAVDDERDDDA